MSPAPLPGRRGVGEQSLDGLGAGGRRGSGVEDVPLPAGPDPIPELGPGLPESAGDLPGAAQLVGRQHLSELAPQPPARGTAWAAGIQRTLPRIRVDQVMNFTWKFMLPMAFSCIFAVAAWHYADRDLDGWAWSLLIVAIAYFAMSRVFKTKKRFAARTYRYAE